MSSVEIFAVAFGLVFGYLAVDHFLKGKPASNPPGNPEGGRRPWHVVLEVPRSASLEEIAAAYRTQTGKYHPDKVASLGREFGEIAEARTKEINAAYEEALRERGSAS